MKPRFEEVCSIARRIYGRDTVYWWDKRSGLGGVGTMGSLNLDELDVSRHRVKRQKAIGKPDLEGDDSSGSGLDAYKTSLSPHRRAGQIAETHE